MITQLVESRSLFLLKGAKNGVTQGTRSDKKNLETKKFSEHLFHEKLNAPNKKAIEIKIEISRFSVCFLPAPEFHG